MTVAELRQKLEQYAPGAVVVVEGNCTFYAVDRVESLDEGVVGLMSRHEKE